MTRQEKAAAKVLRRQVEAAQCQLEESHWMSLALLAMRRDGGLDDITVTAPLHHRAPQKDSKLPSNRRTGQ